MQPRFLFRYTNTGVEGLAKNKKMVIITSRGGDYTTPETRATDFQEPYLRFIFKLVGISDIAFVIAQPMDMGDDLREQRIKEAHVLVQKVAERF